MNKRDESPVWYRIGRLEPLQPQESSTESAVMFSDEAIDRAVEVLIADSGWCQCRHNPGEKHDVNPPCSTRKNAEVKAREVIAALKGEYA